VKRRKRGEGSIKKFFGGATGFGSPAGQRGILYGVLAKRNWGGFGLRGGMAEQKGVQEVRGNLRRGGAVGRRFVGGGKGRGSEILSHGGKGIEPAAKGLCGTIENRREN